MPDAPKAIEVPGSWVGADELPVHFANAFVSTVGPNAIFLNLGSVVPPNIGGDTEEEREAQARSLSYIPIKPIARVALTPQGLDDLIAALEGARKNYDLVRRAIEEGAQS